MFRRRSLMQKISSYLYSNRVQVNYEPNSSPVEWKIVYQRTIKIYQGMSNTIEFDIKNAQQRRVNVQDLNIYCTILDQVDQEIYTVQVFPIPNTSGLASCTIPADVLEYLNPQFLKYSLYLVNSDNTKIPMYVDAHFSASGTIELCAGLLPKAQPPKIIDTFLYTIDYSSASYAYTYYSEAVDINPLNDINENSTVDLEFWPENLTATVTVQITEDAVVSMATKWHDVETFNITESTTRVYKTYNEIIDYSNNVSWLRIQYNIPQGSGAGWDVTKENGTYTAVLNRPGYNYRINDQVVILGSQVGGDDITNDITITIVDTNATPYGAIKGTGFLINGVAAVDTTDPTLYKNVQGMITTSKGKFDKIVVRL